MGEKDLIALEQYDIAVLRSWKGRDAMLCETNRGLLLLKEYSGTEEHIEAEAWLLDRLSERGVKTDAYVRNKDGKVVTTTIDNKNYCLKKWPGGEEIDIKNAAGCNLAVKTLAMLHANMEEIKVPEGITFTQGRSFSEDIRRHHKELKHVRGFIRAKRRKSDFELKMLECFDLFYGQGEKTLEYMNSGNMIIGGETEPDLCKKTLCHGSYNQHNILVVDRGVFVTNFDRAAYNSRMTDLYLFVRKCMEKQSWDSELGMHMLLEYNRISPMTDEEKSKLYIMFLYPEKFWKIVNHYYNGNKSWVSEKSIGKLQRL